MRLAESAILVRIQPLFGLSAPVASPLESEKPTASPQRSPETRSLDLEIHRRCFSAVLFDLILDLLPFIERAQSGALNSGDMNKHVPAATALRLNEPIPLGRIEPLHRAACHCRSPEPRSRILSSSAAWPPTRQPSCAHFDFGAPAPVILVVKIRCEFIALVGSAASAWAIAARAQQNALLASCPPAQK